ncbi:MAG: AAA family ATPase [Candidatus Anstonellales archaeon]
MYRYSEIESIRVKNFRNIGDIEIDFTKSPIVSLVGENESGKTSIIKAIAVCGLHAWSRDQKGFIRDGTNGFGVQIKLKDGTSVLRVKTLDSNMYQIKYPSGEVWEVNKIEGLPERVKEVLGFIEEAETGEFLQIRTYENQLLFVVTPASTNYKVMYDALKVGKITKAIKLGSIEANELKREIDNNNIAIEKLKGDLSKIRVYDIEPLIRLKERLIKEKDIVMKLENIKKYKEAIDKLKVEKESLSVYTNKKDINIHEVKILNSISNTLLKINELKYKYQQYNKILELNELDLSGLEKLERLINLKNNIEKLNKKLDVYNKVNNMENIDYTVILKFEGIKEVLKNVNILQKKFEVYRGIGGVEYVSEKDTSILERVYKVMELKNIVKRLNEAKRICIETINKVEEYLKYLGVEVERCPRCGEEIVISRRGGRHGE